MGIKLTEEQLRRIETSAHEAAELLANHYCDENDTFIPECKRIAKGIISLVTNESADRAVEPPAPAQPAERHEPEIPIHDFDPGRVDTGICQYRLTSGEICGMGFDVEHHRTNNLVSRLDVLRVITALRDSRRLAAEEGDGPAYAEEIELCDKLAFQVRRLPNVAATNQPAETPGMRAAKRIREKWLHWFVSTIPTNELAAIIDSEIER